MLFNLAFSLEKQLNHYLYFSNVTIFWFLRPWYSLREMGALKLHKQGLYSYQTWQSVVALEVSCSHLHFIWLWALVGLDRQLSWRICFQCSPWVCRSSLHTCTHCKQKWILNSTLLALGVGLQVSVASALFLLLSWEALARSFCAIPHPLPCALGTSETCYDWSYYAGCVHAPRKKKMKSTNCG